MERLSTAHVIGGLSLQYVPTNASIAALTDGAGLLATPPFLF